VGIREFCTAARGFRGVIKRRYSDLIVREVPLSGEVVRLQRLPCFAGMDEATVGIREFCTAGRGFRGVTKQRYSDFIVREVSLSGEVVRLQHLPEPPPPPPQSAAAADETAAAERALAELSELIGADDAAAAIALYQRALADKASGRKKKAAAAAAAAEEDGELLLGRDDDKIHRKAVHAAVKLHLPGIETLTEPSADGGGQCIRLVSSIGARKRNRAEAAGGESGKRWKRDHRSDWPAEAGTNRFLEFTLYKENRDSMDALSQIARMLHVNPNLFSFAGTKDRRAVTSQRVSAFGLPGAKLAGLFRKRPMGNAVAVGDFQYTPKSLQLGMLSGNHFTIVIRDVKFADVGDCAEGGSSTEGAARVEHASRNLATRGFINYFGLQRFGSNAGGATHEIGAALLRSDWQRALSLLLAPREGERADEGAAKRHFAETADADATLAILPRRMGLERALLEGLRMHGASNVIGALSRIPRNLKLLYLHAFQSFVWNHAASERIRRFGCERAVAGDLVVAHEATEPRASEAADALVEAPPAAVVPETLLTSEDAQPSAVEQGSRPDVHVVTEAEEKSGTFDVRQVVLPLPGHQIRLPMNEIADAYHSVLADAGLEMGSFRHKVKEFSLSGAYRKLIQVPEDFEWRLQRYSDQTLPLTPTDMMRLESAPLPLSDDAGDSLALILEFTLPPSTYATMLLRELTKETSEPSRQVEMQQAAVAEGAASANSAAANSAGANSAAANSAGANSAGSNSADAADTAG